MTTHTRKSIHVPFVALMLVALGAGGCRSSAASGDSAGEIGESSSRDASTTSDADQSTPGDESESDERSQDEGDDERGDETDTSADGTTTRTGDGEASSDAGEATGDDTSDDTGPGDPEGTLRVAAEWEPALGALISWPLHIPTGLVVALAEVDQLFVMVEDASEQSRAEAQFTALGIDLTRVTFIAAPQSDAASWTRDWGPFALFDEKLEFHLADPRFLDYPRSRPECDATLTPGGFEATQEDQANAHIADALGYDLREFPFIQTGGNVMFDGYGAAISTCTMTNENRDFGLRDDEFFELVEQYAGVSDYAIVPNFEASGIQHIDCLLKMLDEERIMVARAPRDHESYERYESVVAELSTLRNAYGRPYQILRLDTAAYGGDALAAYMNSLILNKRVFVPLFGIDQDEVALQTWRDAMPGYEVLGFEHSDSSHPWRSFDALHCRVRAMWDPEMLYMTHKRLVGPLAPAAGYELELQVLDYSRTGLERDEIALHWRRRGEKSWQPVALTSTSTYGKFTGEIPGAMAGETIEYYLQAVDRSGRREFLPRSAPQGYYSFDVVSK